MDRFACMQESARNLSIKTTLIFSRSDFYWKTPKFPFEIYWPLIVLFPRLKENEWKLEMYCKCKDSDISIHVSCPMSIADCLNRPLISYTVVSQINHIWQLDEIFSFFGKYPMIIKVDLNEKLNLISHLLIENFLTQLTLRHMHVN